MLYSYCSVAAQSLLSYCSVAAQYFLTIFSLLKLLLPLPPQRFFTLTPTEIFYPLRIFLPLFITIKNKKQMKHTTGQWMQFKGNIVTKSKSTLPIDYDSNICKMNVNLDEAKANASLITSAPDMANLLEWIITEIETTPDCLSDALLGLIKLKAKSIIDNLNK